MILDPPGFARYRLHNSTLEQVATGMRWVEGPVYFPDGAYLLFSDIPNNRIMKFDEKTGQTSIFRAPANFANGNTRDRYLGRHLNAPNDAIVKSDDSVWFTDPVFGISGEWEGYAAKAEQLTTNVYRLSAQGNLSVMISDLLNPNGLAFSPDGSLSNKIKLIDGADHAALDGLKVDVDGNLWVGYGSDGALFDRHDAQLLV